MSLDWKWLLVRSARVVAISWASIFAIAYLGQHKLLYMPFGDVLTPAEAGFRDARSQPMTTADGETITRWTKRAAPGKPTIMYFHGNGGSLAMRASRLDAYGALGYGIVAISYRSFTGSTGTPSERANVADAIAAYDDLRNTIPASDIVLHGESLGTGVAAQLAAARPAAALVLETPYSSVADVAAGRFWYLPVHYVIHESYDSMRAATSIAAPTLVLAGARDTVVPATFARKLYAAFKSTKHYVEYPNGSHVDLWDHGALTEITRWIETHRQPTN